MDTCVALETILATDREINLIKTFECGQCFRWQADEMGIYTGVVSGKVLNIRQEKGLIFCDAIESDLPFWRNYFDLDTPYDEAAVLFSQPEHLKICAEYGAGIRILRQEPWEALCSFIISQCNNIPRIKSIIRSLSALYGKPLRQGLFSFPEAEVIANLSEDDLSPLRCGYRAKYILDAARTVSEGRLPLEELYDMPADEARKKIKTIRGVGDKVADCFMLYGLHRMDSFPVDVWMKRALKKHFPPDFDPKTLGNWAGLAQQYIFFYERSSKGEK
jgi:N-glycosylase/DNA lyase